MKKPLLLVLAVMFCFSLIACAGETVTDTPPASVLPSSNVAAIPSLSVLPSSNASVTPSVLSTPSGSLSPSPAVMPDTNIPDVVLSPADFIVRSGSEICEDENYICYFFRGIRVLDKHTGKNRLISDYRNFTLYNEKIYYADDGWIQCCDITTGKNVNLLAVKNEVLSLLGHEDRLYYSYCVNNDFEDAYDIFSITLDGNDLQPLGPKEVSIFCFADGKLYYDTPTVDLPPVYEYNLETGDTIKLCESNCSFQIYGGMLYYSDLENNCIKMIGLESKAVDMITDNSSVFALLGQYVLYITHEAKAGVLYAYDMGSRKTYKLLKFEEAKYSELYSTPYGAYISFYRDGYTEPCRIVISNGVVSLEKISDI